MPEPQGARIPAPRVHPPHAAKAMSNQQMIPDGLLVIVERSRPSITSTTNGARCVFGSHSSTDGGNRNPVSRSIGRKLLIDSSSIHHVLSVAPSLSHAAASR